MDNDTWDEVSAELELVVTEALGPFDEETIANGREFLTLARGLCVAPDDFGKGYWSTFRFIWSEVEVEVFGGHLETYRGEEIAHFERHPGQPFPLDFIGRLPKAWREPPVCFRPVADVRRAVSYHRMTWATPPPSNDRFRDTAFSANHRCALGIDQATSGQYLSIPVSNRLVDYVECYRLTPEEYDAFMADPALAYGFANRCRNRELDIRLIMAPGADRGISR